MGWLTADIQLLAFTAVTVGIVHTLIGPDHYLPFVALARERGWSLGGTLARTAACGVAHCASSVALGMLGILAGLSLSTLDVIQDRRGDIAAWLLLGFGLALTVWGLKRARRGRPHSHRHVHADGTVHTHTHTHDDGHVHVHASRSGNGLIIGSLLTVFILGPCEALIPMLMYPAAVLNFPGLVFVTLVFSIATVLTMLAAVAVGYRVTARVTGLSRHTGTVSGVAVTGCAVAMLAGL